MFRSVHTVPDENELWEECICLIEAASSELALEKARKLGKDKEVTYIAKPGDEVKWEFVLVERVFEILDDRLLDGVELFSRFIRKSEAQSLLTPFEEHD